VFDVNRRLIIFTRFPEPGRVKTRLIPVLGPQGSADLHRRLTALTIEWALELMERQSIQVDIYFDGGTAEQMKASFGRQLHFTQQIDGDLGQRLIASLGDVEMPTVVVGTDCPQLGRSEVVQAFEVLETRDLVLGPARDGGYYLIGLKEPMPQIFMGIEWGTNNVCRATQEIAARRGVSVSLLKVLDDIDRPEDLQCLDDHSLRRLRVGHSPGDSNCLPKRNR
jgi:rSAM/selenodomain-associated transferase 1